jgi:hypothetical protein
MHGGGVAGSQPMSTAVHMGPNKLRRSNAIFNLWMSLRDGGGGAGVGVGRRLRCQMAVVTATFQKCGTFTSWISVENWWP